MLLLVTDRSAFGKQLAQKLLQECVYTFRASFENGAFYCDEKDTGGVIFDGVCDLARAEELCKKLKKEYPELPTALLAAPNATPNAEADRIIRETDPDVFPLDLSSYGRREQRRRLLQRLSSITLTKGIRAFTDPFLPRAALDERQ